MFPKKSKEKIKKLDILITSLVLGTIISGAFGLKNRLKKQEDHPSPTSLIAKIFKIFLGK